MIGKDCRSLRLPWIAGLGVALAVFPAVRSFGQTSTTTTLSAQSSTQACSASTASTAMTTTLTTLTVGVSSASGVPSGTVNIEDAASPTATPTTIASATLDTTGHATVSLYLASGSHTLTAVYTGSTSYTASTSLTAAESISAQCSSDFVVSVSNISPSNSGAMTLTAGQSGTATITVTPSQEFVAALATTGAPTFVTISCAGLPSESSCSFTPTKLAILPGQDAGVNGDMVIQTTSATVRSTPPAAPTGRRNSPVAWAILLPGLLGLGGLTWGVRRRRWLQRLALVLLLGLVTTLGTTGCNPLYYYHNYGPSNPHQTATGTFNITITGQSSDGVVAVTNSTTMVLTVQP